MNKFIIGNAYISSNVTVKDINASAFYKYTVIKRTPKTITFEVSDCVSHEDSLFTGYTLRKKLEVDAETNTEFVTLRKAKNARRWFGSAVYITANKPFGVPQQPTTASDNAELVEEIPKTNSLYAHEPNLSATGQV